MAQNQRHELAVKQEIIGEFDFPGRIAADAAAAPGMPE
jgi:hypothetical protein